MPKVGKVAARSAARPATKKHNKLKSIHEASSKYGLRVALWGRTKTGKTTLAFTFPKPILLVATMGTLEDGTKSIEEFDESEAQMWELEKPAEVDDICEIAVSEGFKTIIVDKGTGLQDAVFKDVLELNDMPAQGAWGMAFQTQWQTISAQTKERLRQFYNLSMTDGIHVVVIADERNFREEGAESSSDLQMIPSVGAALSPAVAGWLNGACDYICQCYIREGIEVKQSTIRDKKSGKDKVTTIKQRTGKAEYCLRIGPHPIYQTGFRKPRNVEIPDLIVDPDYDKIMKVIQGKKL